jgi:hypothetical protein
MLGMNNANEIGALVTEIAGAPAEANGPLVG